VIQEYKRSKTIEEIFDIEITNHSCICMESREKPKAESATRKQTNEDEQL
jgi:hypothetical protein